MSELAGYAGVDEAGRGPLAGPVVAAAVVLPTPCTIIGINDSKKLSAKKRTALAGQIKSGALAWAIAAADSAEVDRLNILNATFLAMQRAVQGLPLVPGAVHVDGNRCPVFEVDGVELAAHCIVGGDASDIAIAAASILAKVWRDEHMQHLDTIYPGYGFAKHKGYPTAAHTESLRRLGPCPEHRESYAPVRAARDSSRE